MPIYKHQVPKLVTDIYREVLRLTQDGNDIFFSFDSQFKTISVRGYLGNCFFQNRKPIINEVAIWDNGLSLRKLMKKIRNVYSLDEEKIHESVAAVEEDLEAERE